jgi:hypothetical protein
MHLLVYFGIAFVVFLVLTVGCFFRARDPNDGLFIGQETAGVLFVVFAALTIASLILVLIFCL